jgi:[protein-PII] uridylyltransferase
VTSAERQQQLLDAALSADDASTGAHVDRSPRRGLAYCRALSDITDDWVIDIFDRAVAEHPVPSGRLALLAVGGYGRGELAPASDLDLLLLHDLKPKKVKKFVEPVASAVWYPLWDSGVRLGHAVRRLDEQLALVRDDLDTSTALLTARPLAGDDSLAEEVIAAGRDRWRRSSERFLAELRGRVRRRQESAGDVSYRLEPDLKDGHGGLRDVQTLWWAEMAGLDIRPEDLVELAACYDTLSRARVALHQATGRPGEVLRLEDQDATAAAGGWGDADELMSSVAAAGRSIAWLGDENWGRAVESDATAVSDRPVAPGIALSGGEIELADGADPAADPTLVLQAAVAAARHECRIGRATLDRLHDDLSPWAGQWPVGATDELVALLLEGHRAIPVLEALDQRALIARLLPEWEPVRSKPQRNAYHRFTVDRHLWEAAANAAALAERVSRPDLLVIGALLHDLGKGYQGDHTEVGMALVRSIAPRLGFGEPDVEMLVAMVEHHLLLPDVAMRRDLSDEATIEQVATTLGSVEALELLHALTEADSLATGPSAWGSWKEGLVNELVDRVRHLLGGGDLPEATWRLFPDAGTLALMATRVTEVVRRDDVITVVNPDAAGNLSQIAGVLSLHGLDVLSARAHSDEQGTAAAQFRVESTSVEPRWEAIELDLRRALAHELAIEARLEERARTYRRRRRTQAASPGPPRVDFDDEASSNATVIVVHGTTTIGILYRITKTLAELGLDIRHATVQTVGMEVVDTFYVRTVRGALVTDPTHRVEIQRAILHVVSR